MPSGRHSLPDEIKRRKGTLHPGRVNKRAPRPPGSKVPPPPRDLSPTEREVWNRLTAAVNLLGIYTPADEQAFRVMVKTVALAEDVDDNTPPTARARALQSAHSALSLFGLTPASRGKVEVTSPVAPGEDDPLAEFTEPPPSVQ